MISLFIRCCVFHVYRFLLGFFFFFNILFSHDGLSFFDSSVLNLLDFDYDYWKALNRHHARYTLAGINGLAGIDPPYFLKENTYK